MISLTTALAYRIFYPVPNGISDPFSILLPRIAISNSINIIDFISFGCFFVNGSLSLFAVIVALAGFYGSSGE
jgi:hypothetical protein